MRPPPSERGRAALLLLAAWAIAATVVALYLYVDRVPRAPDLPDSPEDPRAAEEVRVLRERVRILEAARSEAVSSPESHAPREPTPESDASPGLMPSEDEVLALLAAYRKAVAAGETPEDPAAAKTLAALTIMAEHDARAHLALVALLEIARDENDLFDLLDAIPLSWEGGPRDAEVTKKVLAAARSMLSSENPNRRATAGELLLGYSTPTREDFLLTRDAVLAETDATARGRLLDAIASHGFGISLEPQDQRSIVILLSRAVREGGTYHTNNLAHWSDQREDFDLVVGLLAAERRPGWRQALLTGLRGGVALTRGREDEAEEILVRVLSDPVEDVDVRRYALTLLDSHKPWGERTAASVDRYREEVKER